MTEEITTIYNGLRTTYRVSPELLVHLFRELTYNQLISAEDDSIRAWNSRGRYIREHYELDDMADMFGPPIEVNDDIAKC